MLAEDSLSQQPTREKSMNFLASETYSLDSLKRVLVAEPKDRSAGSVKALMKFTQEIKFFKDLVEEQGDEAHFQCCKYMRYELLRNNQFVFHKGDTGAKFYIILSGHCSVLVPLHIHGHLTYQTVSNYGPGDSFGELALLRHSHRTAAVRCVEDCQFAVLDREEFDMIVGKLKETILGVKVGFLTKFPFFATWPKGELLRISYYFYERTYSLNQTVFHAGDPASELYFIKEGEFQEFANIPAIKSTPSLRTYRASTRPVEFTILTKDQMFGEEGIAANVHFRGYTVRCHSGFGQLLVISKEDFVNRIGTEVAMSYLKRVYEQKKTFRTSRLAALSLVQELKYGDWGEDSPRAMLSASVSSSLERDLRLFSIGHLPESPEILTPRSELTPADLGRKAESRMLGRIEEEESAVEKPRPSWDLLLRLKQAERSKKRISKARPVVNIHVQLLREQAAARLNLSPRYSHNPRLFPNLRPTTLAKPPL